MPNYSYIVGDHYIYKKELIALIDLVDIDRRERRAEEQRIWNKKEVYLSTTFKEDLIKLIEGKVI